MSERVKDPHLSMELQRCMTLIRLSTGKHKFSRVCFSLAVQKTLKNTKTSRLKMELPWTPI